MSKRYELVDEFDGAHATESAAAIRPSVGLRRGVIYTFYSFKGGVGRSMALANVGAALARRGRRVLLADWDLEAPGLERFFAPTNPQLDHELKSRPGIIDLVLASGVGEDPDWRNAVIPLAIEPRGALVSLISAGRSGSDYAERLQQIDFERLYSERGLGSFVERLREEWITEFDVILIDSRTGVTDIGGICTVQLADVVVTLFTTTEASVVGTKDVIARAFARHQDLPVDRQRLVAVPVPARDESRTEYQEAARWKARFAQEFAEVYREWLPRDVSVQEAIDVLRIPYVPYWSFGERLPVIEEGTGDPSSLGYSYDVLSRLLDARLDWGALGFGETRIPDGRIDPKWAHENLEVALRQIESAGVSAYLEVQHEILASNVRMPPDELTGTAIRAQDRTLLRPIGAVHEAALYRPQLFTDSIQSQTWKWGAYDYWALRGDGAFYSLMTFTEEEVDARSLCFDEQVLRVVETLLHCERLYGEFGADGNATVEVRFRYSGLTGWRLRRTRTSDEWYELESPRAVQTMASATFRLGALRKELAGLTQELCRPLAALFTASQFPRAMYENWVELFVGRLARVSR